MTCLYSEGYLKTIYERCLWTARSLFRWKQILIQVPIWVFAYIFCKYLHDKPYAKQGLDKGGYTGTVLLNHQKVFDTVGHKFPFTLESKGLLM